MRKCLISFRSVTPAQKGEQVLRQAGVSCSLQRTPKWMQEKGCGYTLRLWERDISRAIALFRQNSVSYKTVYLVEENGSFREWTV